MLKKNVWIAVLLIAALAFVFVGCQDRPDSGKSEEVETNSLMFTTSVTWGAGIDLDNAFLSLAAGDKITIKGRMHEDSVTSKVEATMGPGSGDDIMRLASMSANTPFDITETLTAGNITQLGSNSIRILARASGAKVVLQEILIERGSTVLFKLSEHLDGLEEGPVAHDNATVFSKGLKEASDDGKAATFAIIAGTPVLPCTNEECRCLACDSKCDCWDSKGSGCFSTRPELDGDGEPTGNTIFGCCFVEDFYTGYNYDGANGELDFTKTGFTTGGEFYLNLNDYKQVGATAPAGLPTTNLTVECPKCLEIEDGTCTPAQLANHVLQPERIKLNFTANNQRVGFKLADWQAELLGSASIINIEIDGKAYVVGTEIASKTPFRFFIGDMKTGSNWNATNFPNFEGTLLTGQGTFDNITDIDLFFNSNKNADTVKYFIFQQRAEASTTVEIKSIKITVQPAVVLTSGFNIDLSIPRSGATAQTFVRGDGFTGQVTWKPTPSNGRFQALTSYFASVLITPEQGVVIPNGVPVTINGANANSTTYNSASQSVEVNSVYTTGAPVSQVDIFAGDIDALIRSKFEATRGADIAFSLDGESDAEPVGTSVTGLRADGGTANLIKEGINYVTRSSQYNGVQINLNDLGINPAAGVYKLTVLGAVTTGTPEAMKLITGANANALEGSTLEMFGDIFKITYTIPKTYLQTVTSGNIRLVSGTATQLFRVATLVIEEIGERPLALIDIKALPVSGPVVGGTPDTSISTFQYTGAVTWVLNENPFQAKAYTATVVVTAKPGFTLEGLPANFFTVAGATTVTNTASTGNTTVSVTVAFPTAKVAENINYVFDLEEIVKFGGARVAKICAEGCANTGCTVPAHATVGIKIGPTRNADDSGDGEGYGWLRAAYPVEFAEGISINNYTHIEFKYTAIAGDSNNSKTFGFYAYPSKPDTGYGAMNAATKIMNATATDLGAPYNVEQSVSIAIGADAAPLAGDSSIYGGVFFSTGATAEFIITDLKFVRN